MATDGNDKKDEEDKKKFHYWYELKKTFAEGMADITLLNLKAAGLRALVVAGPDKHLFYYPLLVLLPISIFLQALTALLLVCLATTNEDDDKNGTKDGKIRPKDGGDGGDGDVGKVNGKKKKPWWKSMTFLNDLTVALFFVIMLLDVVLSGLDFKSLAD